MAGKTIGGGSLIAVGMAGTALHTAVSSRKGETRTAVIKVGATPTLGCMTGTAIRAKLPVVFIAVCV